MELVWVQCVGRSCRCDRCGKVIAKPRNHQAEVVPHGCLGPKPGLGDRVAAVLSAVGITEDRAQAVAKSVGIKDCGCKRRREALNKLGEKLGLSPGRVS